MRKRTSIAALQLSYSASTPGRVSSSARWAAPASVSSYLPSLAVQRPFPFSLQYLGPVYGPILLTAMILFPGGSLFLSLASIINLANAMTLAVSSATLNASTYP